MPMNRRRSLLPEQFQDEELNRLTLPVRYTAIGLRLFADDHGRESCTESRIKAAVYPMDREMTESVVTEHLLELAGVQYLDLYSVGERDYFAIRDWPRVDKPQPSRIPAPPSGPSFSNHSGTRPDPFAVEERESERAGEWEGEVADRTNPDTPPSPFCRNHPSGTDAPCRACGTARLRHRQWTDQQLHHAAAPADDL